MKKFVSEELGIIMKSNLDTENLIVTLKNDVWNSYIEKTLS